MRVNLNVILSRFESRIIRMVRKLVGSTRVKWYASSRGLASDKRYYDRLIGDTCCNSNTQNALHQWYGNNNTGVESFRFRHTLKQRSQSNTSILGIGGKKLRGLPENTQCENDEVWNRYAVRATRTQLIFELGPTVTTELMKCGMWPGLEQIYN